MSPKNALIQTFGKNGQVFGTLKMENLSKLFEFLTYKLRENIIQEPSTI